MVSDIAWLGVCATVVKVRMGMFIGVMCVASHFGVSASG